MIEIESVNVLPKTYLFIFDLLGHQYMAMVAIIHLHLLRSSPLFSDSILQLVTNMILFRQT